MVFVIVLCLSILNDMMLEFVHSGILIVTIGLAFLLGQSELSQYDLQIFAILFIVLYVGKRFLIPRSVNHICLNRSYLRSQLP